LAARKGGLPLDWLKKAKAASGASPIAAVYRPQLMGHRVEA